LDFRHDTIWMSEDKELAEMRVEFPKKQAVDAIYFLTTTYSSAPKFVSVGVVLDKKSRRFDTIATDVRIPFRRGYHWFKIEFPPKVSKYYHIRFTGNHGDDEGIAIREVRFIRARESE